MTTTNHFSKKEYTDRALLNADKDAILNSLGSKTRISVHKKSRQVLKKVEANWTDEAHARYAELFPTGYEVKRLKKAAPKKAKTTITEKKALAKSSKEDQLAKEQRAIIASLVDEAAEKTLNGEVTIEEKDAELEDEELDEELEDEELLELSDDELDEDFGMENMPEFPGEEHIEQFEHDALSVYGDEVDFYIDEDANVWDENMEFVGKYDENDDVMFIREDYEFQSEDDELTEEEKAIVQEEEAKNELLEIAKLEMALANRKKAAKKSAKQAKKIIEEAKKKLKKVEYDRKINAFNIQVSRCDNSIALMQEKREKIIAQREKFISNNPEFTPKKVLRTKKAARQHCPWTKEALTFIRSAVTQADGKISPAQFCAEFKKQFNTSRSDTGIGAQISKQKNIYNRRELDTPAKEIGSKRTWSDLYSEW